MILGISVGLVVWKNKVGGQGSESFDSFSRSEMEMYLGDTAKANPMVIKRLKEDPETKKKLVENFKQLLAFASQAQRKVLPPNQQTNRNSTI